MTLTRAQMELLDEQPTRRRGGHIFSFGYASETRSRLPVQRPAWQIAAGRRARRLELLGYLIEKEERR